MRTPGSGSRSLFYSILLACLLLGTPHLLSQRPKVEIWAVDDTLRVSPVSGVPLIQDRTDIHPDYPAGEIRRQNRVWDGGEGKVTLSAARNEFIAFQLIIEASEGVTGVEVAAAPLVHAEGAKIDGRSLQIFKEWYVEVRRPSLGYEATSLGPGWYADALMPKRRASLFSGFPFSIPDLYNNISGQTNQAVWIDIYVPAQRSDAPPGAYRGELEVSWEGGSRTVAIELQVWDFALPEENHLPGDIWNNSMRRMPPEEERAYYHMARRHRFLPLVYAYRPELQIEGDRVKIDWATYDERVGPYLDGSAFTDRYGYWGPGYGRPVHHVMLPFNVDSEKHPGGAWPISRAKASSPAQFREIWKEVGRQFRRHFEEKPEWNGVAKVAFLNGLDESYFEDAYRQMIEYGELLHEAMGRDWFWYRIDGGYSEEAMERLAREVDLWVCHTVAFDPAVARRFQERGMKVWFYGPMIYEQKRNSGCGSNTFLDLDLNINRAIGWIGWKYQTGWVEWEFDWNAYASWYEAENFKEPGRYYNGSGQLIYRGEVMNYREPIPSIRLKSTRRGLQDFEYFWLLSELTGDTQKADELVDRVIYQKPFGESALLDTEIWQNDPGKWEEA